MYLLNKNQNKFKICNVIRKLLLQDKTIQLLVGNRIYPIISIEQAGQGSFIVYQRESYSHQMTKQGIYQETADVFVTAVSSDYDESQAIAEAIYMCLQDVYNYTDEETGMIINRINMIDSTEDYAADRYIQVLKFNIQ